MSPSSARPPILRFLLAALIVGSLAGAASGAFGLAPPIRIALLTVGLGGLGLASYRRMRRPGTG
jgi:hypothetical protein